MRSRANDNAGNDPALVTAMTQVGVFALLAASPDAALMFTVTTRLRHIVTYYVTITVVRQEYHVLCGFGGRREGGTRHG